MTEDALAPTLLADIRGMIEEARSTVAAAVNAGLTLLYWRIGKRINDEVLLGERAAYGKEIVATLAQELTRAYNGGFTEKNLRRMMQFAEIFPDEQIVASLIRQLSWTHIIALLPLKQPLQREFYAEMCRIERWSVRTLRRQIDSMLYERIALSKKPDELIRHELDALRATDRLTPRSDLQRSVHPRLPGPARPLLRTRSRGRHLAGDGGVPIGIGRRFRFPGAAATHPGRQRRLLSGLALLQPPTAPAGGARSQAGRFHARRQRPDGAVPALAG
jgi:uncharacterized membrane protein